MFGEKAIDSAVEARVGDKAYFVSLCKLEMAMRAARIA